jgi:shikimate kinase
MIDDDTIRMLELTGALADAAFAVCGGRDITTGAEREAVSLTQASEAVLHLRKAREAYNAAMIDLAMQERKTA